MEYSKYRFNLDMQSYISQVSLPVRQYDTGIVLRINLTDGGVPYIIKDGCRAVFCARKADGNPLMNDCVIEKNTTICYELTQQTTSCSGVVDCEVRLYGSDGNLITTPRFILVIDSRVVHDEDFPLSEAEQTVLDNIILSEQKRQQNEVEREETHDRMLETTEEASSLAATLRQKLDTGDYDGLTPYIGANGNWWIGEEDTGVLASGYTIPLRAGQGSHSLEQQDEAKSNKAVTENSIALGEGSIAGAKGYYFTEIFYGDSTTNPQIRISSVQPTEAGLYISSEALSPNKLFNAPDYEAGDVFNLICNDHFALFGTIVSITNDIITFTGNVSLFKTGLSLQVSYGHSKMENGYYINLVPDYDDYTLMVPSKPLNGVVEVCKTAFSSGYGTISAGEFGDSSGKRTKVVEAYGHTEGVDTIAGYAAHGEGDGCEAPAKYSHAQNKDTKANAYAGTSMGIETVVEEGADGGVATGYKTHARKKYTFTGGDRTEADAEDAVAFGNQTIASALAAFAEGLGFGGAFGIDFGPSEASGVGSHVEGIGTKAMHEGAHAENFGTEARAKATHAGGLGSIASGYAAFIHAMFGLASGSYSAAFNYYTIASGFAQFVAGMYNKENPDALLIVGNGTSDTDRSNAFEVLKNGDVRMPYAAYTQAAYGEFYDYDGEAILYFDFTPCIVFIDGNLNFYDSTTMKDNSYIYKNEQEGYKKHTYCALGYDTPEYSHTVPSTTRIILKDDAEAILKDITVTDEVPIIKTTARESWDDGRDVYSWTLYINNEAADSRITYNRSYDRYILSPNKDSDGSGLDDYVHHVADDGYDKEMVLTPGKTYTFYYNITY